jgi:hypothetical protein
MADDEAEEEVVIPRAMPRRKLHPGESFLAAVSLRLAAFLAIATKRVLAITIPVTQLNALL